MSDLRIVVGAGHAGGELAIRLRQLDPQVPVLLLGEEAMLPYQRPALSKTWLSDPAAVADRLLLRPASAYATAGVQVRTGARVCGIDATSRQVWLDGGEVLRYRQLALATGARPRRLDDAVLGSARDAENLHVLRGWSDARRLRPQFLPGCRLVVVGGGYIGLELAAQAVRAGLRVTVLEAQARVLARVTSAPMSAFLERVHREAGVDIRVGTQVRGLQAGSDGRVCGVCWEDTRGARGSLDADVVVVGIGVVADLDLALQAGLACSPQGVLVDTLCRTSDDAIVAAGDCTCRPVPGHTQPLRVESVPSAMEQARSAASTLCGQRQPCDTVPWFWSDQYDMKLQIAGLSQGHDATVLRGDTASGSFAVLYLRQSTIVAADCVNRPADFMAARRLVTVGCSVDPSVLADPTVALKDLVPS